MRYIWAEDSGAGLHYWNLVNKYIFKINMWWRVKAATRGFWKVIINNEILLSIAIALVYYTDCKDYIFIREMPAGNGFSDMVFHSKRASLRPVLVLEPKWDKAAAG